jgi:hypothetical protein
VTVNISAPLNHVNKGDSKPDWKVSELSITLTTLLEVGIQNMHTIVWNVYPSFLDGIISCYLV